MASVLYADGDSQRAKELSGHLEKDGHTVKAVGSGERAMLEIDSGAQVDAVVVCLYLPGMDGAELCRWVRKRPGSDGITTVAFTACGRSLPDYLRATMRLWLPVDLFLDEACDMGRLAESLSTAIAGT